MYAQKSQTFKFVVIGAIVETVLILKQEMSLLKFILYSIIICDSGI